MNLPRSMTVTAAFGKSLFARAAALRPAAFAPTATIRMASFLFIGYSFGKSRMSEVIAKVPIDSLPPGGGGVGWGGACREIRMLQIHPPPHPLPSREGA